MRNMMKVKRDVKKKWEMGLAWGSTLTLATPAWRSPLLLVGNLYSILYYVTVSQAYGAAGERG